MRRELIHFYVNVLSSSNLELNFLQGVCPSGEMVCATVRRDGAPQGPARLGLPPIVLLLLLYPRGERGLRLRGRARACARSPAQSRAHGHRQQSCYHRTGNLSRVN